MLQELTSVPLSTGFVCLLEELKSMSAPLGVLDLQAMAAWLKVVGDNRRNGIYRSLLDSSLSDSGVHWVRGQTGQCSPPQNRSWT